MVECQYEVWHGESLGRCGKASVDDIFVPCTKTPSGRYTYAFLCSEHLELVKDSVNLKAIRTSQGLMHVRAIKEMFKGSSKPKKKKCPKCGHIF